MTLHLKQKKRNQTSGFSIIEILLFLTISGIMVTSLSRFILSSQKSTKSTQSIVELNQNVSRIKDIVENPEKLMTSIMSNTTLVNCIKNSCSPSGNVPFALLLPNSVNKKLAGPLIYYSEQGGVCEGNSCNAQSYPIQALAAYSGNGTTLQISFCLRLRNASNATLNGLGFTDSTNFPACVPFITGAATAAAQPLLRPNALTYAPTSNPLSYVSLRALIADAESGGGGGGGGTPTPTGPGNNPSGLPSVASSGVCSAGQVMVGIDNATKKPLCNKISSAVTGTEIIKRTFPIRTGECGCWGSFCHGGGFIQCPAGKIAVGGGAQCQINTGGITLDSYAPWYDATRWFVDCCSSPTGGDLVQAFAVCAYP